MSNLRIGGMIQAFFATVRNLPASLRRRGMDYVLLQLEGSYPERRDPGPSLPFPLNRLSLFPEEPGLEDVREMFDALARDRRVRGVVLRIGDLDVGPSTVRALREMVAGIRAEGKEVVAWLPQLDTWTAYLSSACDRTFLPESASVFAAGLRTEVLFLQESLAQLGIEADFESLREYKVTPDTFRRSSMTDPHREMLASILDDVFDQILGGIAEGRDLEPETVRELMGRMPLSAEAVMEAGLVDGLLYEDQLASELGEEEGLAPLLTWQKAQRWLRRPVHWRRQPAIGFVSAQGLIVPGESRRLPPIPLPLPMERQAGARTVVQALRAAEQDRRIAAVIFHVESRGGSALASDLIWREVRRLRERKPVVALLGDQATSGGYYISAPASSIVAQPLTLTGSIGIWGGQVRDGGPL